MGSIGNTVIEAKPAPVVSSDKIRTIGFKELMRELEAGNPVYSEPYSRNDYMVINGTRVTVRSSATNKMYEMMARHELEFEEGYKEGDKYVQERRLRRKK